MARILVIEDNPANLELMTYLLTAFGHTSLSAITGEEGLERARRESPDLIVCDIHLPVKDGYEVARRLKKHAALRAIPLVAVTALAMVGDRDRVLSAGFDGYISKPIDPETFVRQVESFLRPDQLSTRRPETASAAPDAPSVVAATSSRATILIVDNMQVNRDLLRSILEPSGYTVVAARSVREALAIARQSPPDLILSDLNMPGGDGIDLVRAVQADTHLRHIDVIIHSATVLSQEDRAKALAAGEYRFIARPVEPQILLREIEACLARRSPHPSEDRDERRR
jgi:two-component system cell cycle response regulator